MRVVTSIGTVVGTLLFGVLSSKAVAAVVGVLTLLFLAQRLVFPPRAEIAERRHGRLEHACGHSSPPGVRDAHRNARTVGEEHRQAVGGEDRADDVALAGDGGIGNGRREDRRLSRQRRDRGPVDLIEPYWR